MGAHEPYWRTNTSFSPSQSRWDFSFPSEEPLNDLHEDGLPFGSSTSSGSGESRHIRRTYLNNHQFDSSDGSELVLSSPDISQGSQWMPPAIQEISFGDYKTATRRSSRNGGYVGGLPPATTTEGNSENSDSSSSTSYHSDSGESGATFKSRLSSHHNFSTHRSFLSKPIHPLFLPNQTPRESSHSASSEFSEFDAATPQRDTHHWSSAGCTDLLGTSEPFGEHLGRSCISSDGCKCGLCEKFLSQRSPWGARRIVRSGDMPVASVLSCCHVFHAECLEQATPKARKMDPPCPLCARLEHECLPEQVFSRLRNDPSRTRPPSEDGTSQPWGCAPKGDVVEGGLHPPPPPHNTVFLLNRNRIQKNLSLKGYSGREFPGRLKNSSLYSLPLLGGNLADHGVVGCSETTAGTSLKR